RLVEVLKQPQYQPLPVEKQVAIIYAATNGFLDPVPVEEVSRYEQELYRFLESRHPGVLTTIAEKRILDDQTRAALNSALKEFADVFGATMRQAAVAGTRSGRCHRSSTSGAASAPSNRRSRSRRR